MSTTQIVESTTVPSSLIAEKSTIIWHSDRDAMSSPTPDTQSVLLLHGAKQDYSLTEEAPVPEIQNENEILIQTKVIGLNPIDWKGP